MKFSNLKEKLTLRRFNGPLTNDLVQAPSKYGFGRLPKKLQPDAAVNSICGYCSTGCSLKIHLLDGEAVNLSANINYPVNLGMACPKGWESLTPLSANDRATQPMIRNENGDLSPVSWHEAMLTFCDRLKKIQNKYGNESLAFLSTGQIVTEEMAFLGSLAKFGMGIIHGDGNTRQCMATAATAYKQSFGYDAPPYTYKDFEESDVLVFIGANPCIAHPIMWQRVMMNKHKPKIIVIDPRKTETAMAATHHLALKPKSDLELFYGIASEIINIGAIDTSFINNHTNGFESFAEFLSDYNLRRASEATGLRIEALNELVHLIASGKRVSFWWTMGVNQSYEGTRLAQSIINLALMTGNIGRPGTGANSITGQCNAMGSRLFSNTTSLLGGRNFEDIGDRRTVSNILDIPLENIPDKQSLSYYEIIDAIDAGKIKGLWLIATNTAHSWINQKRFRKVREKLDFLVVQDMFHSTESAVMADLLLPAAGWGEKDGVFINSERRIARTRKVMKAPGHALSDFSIFQLIAHYWGCSHYFSNWDSPEAVFNILTQLSKGMPCDFSGIKNYDNLEKHGGIQWPCSNSEILEKKDYATDLKQERRLFEDGNFYHEDKKARFIFEAPREVPEPTNEAYPLILLTGRGTSSQWHTQTRTGKSEVLKKLYPKNPYVEISPNDALRLKIKNNDKVLIQSRRGKVEATAVVLSSINPGQLFMPMHYNITNHLTADAFDPYSKQPSYKACAVRIENKTNSTNL